MFCQWSFHIHGECSLLTLLFLQVPSRRSSLDNIVIPSTVYITSVVITYTAMYVRTSHTYVACTLFELAYLYFSFSMLTLT